MADQNMSRLAEQHSEVLELSSRPREAETAAVRRVAPTPTEDPASRTSIW
jgi:hypothetical protein